MAKSNCNSSSIPKSRVVSWLTTPPIVVIERGGNLVKRSAPEFSVDDPIASQLSLTGAIL